ncbi:MAG TPA: right-handed parallel beta-helix repeat-containing protein [Chloroflexota bacterium]|nr:right-handed parallel beta-helix repeat-containing protein [Chloroflexota bacterium]
MRGWGFIAVCLAVLVGLGGSYGARVLPVHAAPSLVGRVDASGAATATPVRTPRATRTPRPTVGPRPTRTPRPTATPLPADLVVTSTGDAPSCPKGPGNPAYTLRCALYDADGVKIKTTISFAIPATDAGCHAVNRGSQTVTACTIAVKRTLPSLTASGITIDGTSQAGSAANTNSSTASGSNAVTTIQIDGSSAPGAGLTIQRATGDTIEGLAITNFHHGSAIAINGAHDALVRGNVIGMTPNGVDAGNVHGITLAGAVDSIIGGDTPGASNAVTASSSDGLSVEGGSGNAIRGNYIGAGLAGASTRGNAGVGIAIGKGAQKTRITDNLITRSGREGILIDKSPVVIERGSFVGNKELGIDVIPFNVPNCSITVRNPHGSVPCPVIRSVSAGQVRGTACKGCTVQLYVAGGDTTGRGFGEGKTYLGQALARTGSWTIKLGSHQLNPATQQVTATDTTSGAAAATSEFALNMPIHLHFKHLGATYALRHIKAKGLKPARTVETGILFSWTLTSQVGVAGFDLYGNGHRLDTHMIRARSQTTYKVLLRLGGHRVVKGPFTLSVLLKNGLRQTFPIQLAAAKKG